MIVLLSIKPEYADRIFDGTKRYEFRKTIFKENVNRVVVYASAPVGKVIGEFTIEHILCDQLDNLWKRTRSYAGISEEFFYSYFADRSSGYAIKIGDAWRYNVPYCIREAYGIHPPQSFVYLCCPWPQKKNPLTLDLFDSPSLA
jgi:predicted transcriptional regulator